MSKLTTHVPPAGSRSSVDDRLARVLDSPSLARIVPHLPTETLHQLIRARGLEACAGLVTAASPAQLTAVLDLDLWRQARPGLDDRLDVDRFGEWLEVLVEAGESAAARTVAAMDAGVVVAGLSRFVRVFDIGIFEPTAQSDDEAIERRDAMREGDAIAIDESGDRDAMYGARAPALESHLASLECEVGGYVVRPRRADAWDAVVTLLIALDAERPDAFHAVMRGCRAVSNSRPEYDGLDDLLLAPEQQLHDVTIAREQRRSAQGYATRADARAFLQVARRPRMHGEPTATARAHPLVAAYYRDADDAEARSDEAPPPAAAASEEVHAVIALLAEAGMVPERPRALLGAAADAPEAVGLPHLHRLMTWLRDADEAVSLARGRELGFLANTLIAGCSLQSRPFTPQEASDAAASICNLGLERWAGSERLADAFLVDHDLVAAFERGWSTLHHEVGLRALDRLIAVIDDLRCSDRDIRQGLAGFRRALTKARDAGTPWLARSAADVLAELDMTAWASVLGLLDECPVVPEALLAILDGRTAAVSPTAFTFIATSARIGDVGVFLRLLPDVLSR